MAQVCPIFVAAFSHIPFPGGLRVALVAAALALAAYAGCLLLVGVTFSGRYAGGEHPESQIAHLAGGPVRYVEEPGTTGTPPLLLLHGYQGTLSQWNATWEQLSSCSAPRIRIDIPGFGRSVWNSNDFSLTTQADRVIAFLDSKGIRQVVLAGTSMGASLAAVIAARHPQRVTSLALFAPSGYPGSLTYDGLFGALAKPGLLNSFALIIADTRLFRMIFPTSVAIETLTTTASYGNGWVALLSTIRAPTLIVWSRGDRTVAPQAATYVQAAIDGSHLLMLDEEAGHSTPIMRPELTAALLCALSNGVSVAEILTDPVRQHLRPGEVLLPRPTTDDPAGRGP